MLNPVSTSAPLTLMPGPKGAVNWARHLLHVRREPTEVATANVGLHHHQTLRALPVDLHGAALEGDVGELCQRHSGAIRRGNGDRTNRLH